MKSVSVIIPIYNLSSNRFGNFCFIVKQFYKILHLCDVYVVEQLSDFSVVQSFLQKYPGIKHIMLDMGEAFNKSKLINYGAIRGNSDFIWVVDGDFYTDYEYVLESVDEYSDFMRPFSKTILLNEDETEELIELGYVTMNRKEYSTNSTDGKFSFIVNRDVFVESHMMNEDFVGWGYQDLDFMENRLVECSRAYIDTFGFHMYHHPANKQYVNRNKRLFLNISSVEKLPKEITDIEEITTEEDVEEPSTADILVEQEVVSVKKDPVKIVRRDVTHIHHRVWKTDLFSTSCETHIIDDSNSYTTSRDISGRLKTKRIQPHFMFVYFRYIVENYDELNGIYIFSTDLFYKSRSIFGSEEIQKIADCLELGFVNFKGFELVTSISRLALNHGHSPEVSEKSKYKYNDWVGVNIKRESCQPPRYSLPGCFATDSQNIKSQPIDYYKEILKQMPSWAEEDYLFLMASLENIFA